jgi:hypothetical protein
MSSASACSSSLRAERTNRSCLDPAGSGGSTGRVRCSGREHRRPIPDLRQLREIDHNGNARWVMPAKKAVGSLIEGNIIRTDISSREWTNSLFLQYTLPNTAEGLEARIITHLTTDQKIIKQQASLFAHETGTIEIGTYDITTKEALPASTKIAQRQHRQIRECTDCESRSAIWRMRISSDGLMPADIMPAISETDDMAAKWHQRWQIHCICGGSWRPI